LSVVQNGDYVTQKRDSEGQVLWEARYTSRVPGFDEATSIAVDEEGNVQVAGVAGGGFATIKYGADGHELWSARYEGPAVSSEARVSLGLDPAGNVLVSGEAGFQVATVKYSRLGELLWVAQTPRAGFWTSGAFALDASGDAYVVESSLDFCGFEGCLEGEFTTSKIDPDGRDLWARQFDTPGFVIDSAADIALGPDDTVHVAGDTRPCWDTGFYVACGPGELVVLTYDPEGTLLWVARKARPPETYYASAISVGPKGTVYVAGGREGNFVTLKYSADGEELWEAVFSPENPFQGPSALRVDPEGSAVVVDIVEDAAGGLDYALVKYDGDGKELWKTFYDGPRGGEAVGWSPGLALDTEGSVYLAGRSGSDFATLKYDAAGSLVWAAIRPGDASYREATSAVALDRVGNV